MKYESSILKRLVDTYGVVGNPRYISEIIKEFIVRGKERFPELFTYQADWLAHIDEFGLNPTYTVSYTGQSIYAPNTLERPVKSAILTGSTKYRDIDTGEILDVFDETKNLELVSVKMPVLTTIGKNLFDITRTIYHDANGVKGNTISTSAYFHSILTGQNGGDVQRKDVSKLIKLSKGDYSFSGVANKGNLNLYLYDLNGNTLSKNITLGKSISVLQDSYADLLIPTPSEFDITNIQLEQGSVATTYEPYKSNILTVNEDVTLRSNGDICDELNLLTGQLTQRIGEDGVVLSQEVIKTVDLTILDQNGQNVKQLMSFNGGTHFNTSSLDGSLVPSVDISVVTNLEETLKMCSLEGNTL